jgi:hypothetical protein
MHNASSVNGGDTAAPFDRAQLQIKFSLGVSENIREYPH